MFLLFIILIIFLPVQAYAVHPHDIELTFNQLREGAAICSFEIWPTNIDFGDIEPNETSSSQSINISNTGNREITSLSISATNWRGFDQLDAFLSFATQVSTLGDYEGVPLSSKELELSEPIQLEGESIISLQLNLGINLIDVIVNYVGLLYQTITIDPMCADHIFPIIIVPNDFTIIETELVYFTVTAYDDVDGDIIPTCLTPWNSIAVSGFSMGEGIRTITCTATDSSGNAASASFTVTVLPDPNCATPGFTADHCM